ncbi:MAG: GNAT family N-acetyltransferase [Chloroflexota bacterium]|nr:MAG: GNAT family N-acetyltransferase [Chloroflexota bacterium]
MVAQIKVSVRTATESDRQPLANLIHFETQVHRHLDWRHPLDWIGRTPYLVAERGQKAVAALAIPPDPTEVAWIRLFAVSSDWSANEAWDVLWPAARSSLEQGDPITIAAIPLQSWFRELLEESYFQLEHNIVLLLWQAGQELPPAKDLPQVTVRPMNFDDLPAVQELDSTAFGPLWRNSLESLELAFQQSALATVAENEEGLVGYQISTANPMGAHLARLAVQPHSQSRGIGYALLRDLLDQFVRRGALRVSVNTQENNSVSLALYEKAGFRPTGEVYPVYHLTPERLRRRPDIH